MHGGRDEVTGVLRKRLQEWNATVARTTRDGTSRQVAASASAAAAASASASAAAAAGGLERKGACKHEECLAAAPSIATLVLL